MRPNAVKWPEPSHLASTRKNFAVRTPEKRTAISIQRIEDAVTTITNGDEVSHSDGTSEINQLASFRFGDSMRFMGAKILFGGKLN